MPLDPPLPSPPTPRRIPPLRITAWTATTAAGRGRDALAAALREGCSALTPNDFGPTPLATWIGRVAGLEDAALPAPLASWDCRNNRLAWLGLQQDGLLDAVHAARERLGAGRIAVVLGTSTVEHRRHRGRLPRTSSPTAAFLRAIARRRCTRRTRSSPSSPRR
jgi:hypothetical protein